MGYRSMLSAVFKSVLPEISISPVLHVLLRSFQAEAPIREVRPPPWDLNIVSSFLRSSSFQTWTTISLRDLPAGRCFFFRWLPQRWGVRFRLCPVVFLSLHLLLVCHMWELVAKTESALQPLPHSFEVPSLGNLAAGMSEDLLRCPVRAFSEYLERTSGIVNRPRRRFVSSECPSRAISKNEISYMLRAFIIQSSASSRCGQVPRAPSIGGIATSSPFFRNWSLRSALEVAS